MLAARWLQVCLGSDFFHSSKKRMVSEWFQIRTSITVKLIRKNMEKSWKISECFRSGEHLQPRPGSAESNHGGSRPWRRLFGFLCRDPGANGGHDGHHEATGSWQAALWDTHQPWWLALDLWSLTLGVPSCKVKKHMKRWIFRYQMYLKWQTPFEANTW